MFAWSHMDAEIDRPIYYPEEPSLSDMTAKAIDLLSQNPYGFLLMVEGSEIDWAGHNNDPVWMATDFIEFDNAVKVALDFAKADGKTLVLAYPDHNTGGMDIGNRDYNGAYTHLTVEELLDPLRGMMVTAGSLASEINAMPGGITVTNIQAKTEELWNLAVSDEVAREIIDMTGMQEGQGNYTISFDYALARIISKHYTAIGWTSYGHNAEDVPVWAYGPYSPRGTLDNTELATVVADALGFDLDWVNEYLFVDMDDRFPGWTMDMSDPENPVAKVSSLGINAELPCSKDFLHIVSPGAQPMTYDLPGVVVYVPETGKVFIPEWAASLMEYRGL
jgi:alkaline phosphatase